MRKIGALAQASAARRFESYLVAQGISAQTEETGGAWTVWIREEDQVAAARAAFEAFTADPEAPQFQGHERVAEQRRRDEQARREAAQRNLISPGQRWRPAGRRRPVTLAVVLLCVGIGLFTNMGEDRQSRLLRYLWFSDDPQVETAMDKLADIRHGEIWRIVTPAIVHYGLRHLVFNMVMFYQLASIIEHRQGGWQLTWVMLAIAIPSNLAQALVPDELGGAVRFAGLSGVVFGLLGYVWMKSRFHPADGIYVHPNTLVLPLLFLVLGLFGAFNTGTVRIANWAHGIGFIAGIVVGYLPLVWRSPTRP